MDVTGQLTLVLGTDSTWSLRAWICAKVAGVDLDIEVIKLDAVNAKASIFKSCPSGLVPCLKVINTTEQKLEPHREQHSEPHLEQKPEQHFVIWDSLAIAEYFQEISEGALFPKAAHERALARSLCAELHSGFFHLRSNCPFSLLPVEPLDYDQCTDIQNELQRVESIFSMAKGPFMFDAASAVDGFYAILAYRLYCYGVTFSNRAGEYQTSLLNWQPLQQAIELAKDCKA